MSEVKDTATADVLNTADCLSVVGARVNNLRNIDVDIPHDALTVIT